MAKNRGLAEARGEFIAFCDADDTWRHDKLSKQIPAFADPAVAMVFSDVHHVDDKGEILAVEHMKRTEGMITAALMVDNYIPFPTTVVRADTLADAGGFNENLTMSIDYDCWLRISIGHKFAYVREPLANYRIWAGQMSHRTGKRLDNFFQLLTQFLAQHPDAVTEQEKNIAWAHFFVTRGEWNSIEGRRRAAVQDYLRAMRLHVLDLRLWKRMAALLLNLDQRKE